MAQYIGEKEILTIDGNVVKFVDGDSEEYTEKQLTYMISEEPKDASALQMIVLETIVPEVLTEYMKADVKDVANSVMKILTVLKDHNIRKGDFDTIMKVVQAQHHTIMQAVYSSWNNTFFEAVGKAFGTYNESLSPEYFTDNIRVSDILRLKG